MSIKNKLIFGFSAIGLLFLTVIIGNAIWYHISNVALRLAATTLLLLVLVSIIQILYLLLIHRYKVGI
jgi:membrane protein YdbS with pleckstrin-like domain